MSRYSRHIILSEVGQEGQEKIHTAKVLVVGAGGLGCPVLQYLVAAGVGKIGVIDHDNVEESNLQRQILYGSSSLGINKAVAAKTRLTDLNPTITIESYPEMLSDKNALSLFNEYDIIVDGTDSIPTRYLINDASILTDKPVVYGAIYKFEGQVAVFNYQNGPSYRCLFPTPPKSDSVANCSEIGVLGVLPGIIGTMQANEVIKIILGFGTVLSGKMLCYDARTANSTTIQIKRSEDQIRLVKQNKLTAIEDDSNCNFNITDISVEDAFLKEDTIFLDVREPNESPFIDLDNVLRIPLNSIEANIDEIRSEKSIIVFCQSGVRSRLAIKKLQNLNYSNCYNLNEGAKALELQMKLKQS